ncbi:MAG: hypothetical protein ACI90V_009268 [Bacillariaceae sp.]|jgi:hypothetical protein
MNLQIENRKIINHHTTPVSLILVEGKEVLSPNVSPYVWKEQTFTAHLTLDGRLIEPFISPI